MKKVLGGGLALAFTAGGTLLFAGPGAAQSAEDLQGSISPTVAAPGESINAHSVQGCGPAHEGEPSTLLWEIAPRDPEATESFGTGEAPLDGSGMWSVTITAPSGEAEYSLWGWCPDGDDLSDYRLDFKVQAPAPTTSTSEAPPATAVTGRPDFTG